MAIAIAIAIPIEMALAIFGLPKTKPNQMPKCNAAKLQVYA